MQDSNNGSYDIVVVGAGNAAITAALAAHAEGARVAVLEKADKALRGGNTRFTGGIYRHTYNGAGDLLPIVKDNDNADDVIINPYTRDDYLADMARVTGGRSDPELTGVLIDRSYDTVCWMADLGVPFEFSRVVGGVSGSEKVTLTPRATYSPSSRTTTTRTTLSSTPTPETTISATWPGLRAGAPTPSSPMS